MTTLDDRRTHFLDLARELASGAGTGPSAHLAVAHVTLSAVAEQAGVTRSALYRIWPSQQEFWTDLIEFILLPPHQDADPVPAESGLDGPSANEALRSPFHNPGSAVATPTDTRPAACHVLDVAQDVLLSDPLPLLRTAVVCYPDGSGSHDLVGEHRRRVLPELERDLALSLATAGRRCRRGISITDLATAVTAVGNGLPTIGRVTAAQDLRFDAPVLQRSHGAPASLLGVSVEAITEHLTSRSLAPQPIATESIPERVCRPPDRWNRRQLDYLTIGLDLALSPPYNGHATRSLGHVDLCAVARAGGVTRRTMSNAWSSQEEFRADLFAHLLRIDRDRTRSVIADAASRLRSEPDAVPFRTLGDDLHRSMLSALDDATPLAFAPQLEDPEFVAFAGREQALRLNETAQTVRSLLRATGRRTRNGVTNRKLSVVLLTLLDGMHRLARTDPSLVGGTITTDDGTNTVTGWAVEAVFSQLTEPVVRRPLAVRFASMLA